MEHIRTLKEPHQAIPTFAQTIELLMKVGSAPNHPCGVDQSSYNSSSPRTTT